MVCLVEVTNIKNIYTIRMGARNISIKKVKLQLTILISSCLLLILDETMLSIMTNPSPRRELKNKRKEPSTEVLLGLSDIRVINIK